ncbi:unnamed protein product [Ceratitis capitata]|uniref:(Mediterranean fruit fly) hypothetical protein n=1 Tax=Ceratitis capitata TaxID=7213 RepID=A0A811UJ39_CERCA|nr:unnamed protein product [Ceratitis capitata]
MTSKDVIFSSFLSSHQRREYNILNHMAIQSTGSNSPYSSQKQKLSHSNLLEPLQKWCSRQRITQQKLRRHNLVDDCQGGAKRISECVLARHKLWQVAQCFDV